MSSSQYTPPSEYLIILKELPQLDIDSLRSDAVLEMSQRVKRFFLTKIVGLGYTCSIGCHHVSSATQHLILLSSPQATMAVDPPNECPRIATWHISM